jgi:SAM-dependent methyltransferase
MIAVRAKWSAYVDQQHRYPTGLIGRVIGERMRHQHTPETEWSIELLHIKPSDRVLEIGFGVGRGLALTLRQAIEGHVTGIDISATMIQAALCGLELVHKAIQPFGRVGWHAPAIEVLAADAIRPDTHDERPVV